MKLFSPQNEHFLVLGVAILLVGAVMTSVVRNHYASSKDIDQQWKDLEKLLADKSTWKDAVLGADRLLDRVLKKRHFRGKTMGERLVAAQHHLSANDMVWFSHKLSNKLATDNLDINKQTVKKTLLGFWKALKDLEAFKKK